jgi:hypothetical protein
MSSEQKLFYPFIMKLIWKLSLTFRVHKTGSYYFWDFVWLAYLLSKNEYTVVLLLK